MKELIDYLLNSAGVWGLVVVLLLLAIRKLDERAERTAAALTREHEARLADAKEYATTLLATSERTHEALEHLASLHESERPQPPQPPPLPPSEARTRPSIPRPMMRSKPR